MEVDPRERLPPGVPGERDPAMPAVPDDLGNPDIFCDAAAEDEEDLKGERGLALALDMDSHSLSENCLCTEARGEAPSLSLSEKCLCTEGLVSKSANLDIL